MSSAPAAVLSFEDVVKVEFDFAVRTVKRAAVKFSASTTRDIDEEDNDGGSLAGVPPGSHHLGTLIQALIFELRGRKPHAGRELLRSISHELVLYGHLQCPEFYEGLGNCVTNRQKMQFICLGMKDPSFDGDFIEIFADLVGSGLVSVKDCSLHTLRDQPYNLSAEEARRLVFELVENACDNVEDVVAMTRRMYHPSEETESNACLDAILKSNFFDDIVGGSVLQEKDRVRRAICDVFPAAKKVVDGWIQRHEEEGDSDDSLDSFVVSDREIADEFDDDSDTDATTASEGEGSVNVEEVDDGDDSMSVDEEQAAEAPAEGHGRLRKARDMADRRDSCDISPTVPATGDETRSNSDNDDDIDNE